MKKKEEIKKYDWKDRPLSWSAISTFEWNPEDWYQRYVLNIQSDKTAELEFGSVTGKRLETDKTYLTMIKRHSKMEHEFKCPFPPVKAGLIGYADSFCDKTFKKLNEYKTGKKPWDQKRADEHGQLTMYCLMNYVINKIKPENVEIELFWMPTKDNGDFSISFIEPIEKHIKSFKTKRTMMDIIQFGRRIINVYKQMEQYAQNHE